jgi:hypothetical protein
MRKLFISILTCMAGVLSANAIEDNTVEIIYNGNTATVNIASNIMQYVSVSSGTSSHVVIIQDASFEGVDKTTDNEDGEIIYNLSGSSTDGEFYLEGSYKCTVELNGVDLTNPSGPAVNIQNGKRIAVSVKKDKTSTLTDGANENYNGALHIKGHTKFKGKGTLNVVGNSRHAIYSKEYIEVKNCNINVTAAVKDGIHCKEYFFMESGNVKIGNTGDDGIQVELDGNTSTGQMPSHEDEDSGNFYMTGGTLSMAHYGGSAIKADGTINFNGGTQDFDKDDTQQYAGIENVQSAQRQLLNGIYDLQGRRLSAVPQHRCIYIIIENGIAKKIIRK